MSHRGDEEGHLQCADPFRDIPLANWIEFARAPPLLLAVNGPIRVACRPERCVLHQAAQQVNLPLRILSMSLGMYLRWSLRALASWSPESMILHTGQALCQHGFSLHSGHSWCT